MVLELLAALVGAVAVAHGDRPDAPGHPPEHRVLGVHAVAEEERQVGGEVVDVHAPGQVGLDVGEGVGQGEGELGDRVRARLGDVVAGDRHRVEVPHLLGDEPLLDVGHHPQGELGGEDAGVLALVLLEDVGLHRAPHRAQHVGRGCRRPPSGDGGAARSAANASRRWSMAVQKNMARMVGAGPLIVIDTEVDGSQRSNPSYSARMSSSVAIDTARVADLAVDVGPLVGVEPVEGHRVERGRQPGRRLALGEQVEAAVGAGGVALAGEHAGGVLVLALEGEDPGGEREPPGQVLVAQEAQQVAVVAEAGQRHLGDGVPDSDSEVSGVRTSRSRTASTCSSPE